MHNRQNRAPQETIEKKQRLFVAVTLSEAIRARLAVLQTGLPGMRWIHPAGLHLTVRFIGEVPLSQILQIQAALREVEAECFSLRMRGLGMFTGRSQAILWAGLEKSAGLLELKRQVDTALALYARLRPDSGTFSPHITLGRMNNPDRKALRNFVAQHTEQATADFSVNAFTLFSSVLAPGGAVHTPAEGYLLTSNDETIQTTGFFS